MNQSITEEITASSSENVILVRGEIVSELPQDLYIPPEALRVFLETFQGPLDLLLYLIKKHNIDILDIPIKEITIQYMRYVEIMQELQLELAAEYLLMAAMLAEIKSRLLLPRSQNPDEPEAEDPRAELIRRLQIYECFKKAGEDIDALKQVNRDIFTATAAVPSTIMTEAPPQVPMQALLDAFVEVMTRARLFADHKVEKPLLSIRERMTIILERVRAEEFTLFTTFFTPEEGRMGVVVTFIAILELTRQSMIEVAQNEPYAQIYIKAATRVVVDTDVCESQLSPSSVTIGEP